jgi:quinol monooxygenase YgiN
MPKTTREFKPAFRRLRVYAFDPSLETQLENAVINQVTLKVPWESKLPPDPGEACGDGELQKGPVGEYLEVIDFDPASNCFYAPVNLNDPHLLAQDGLPPSEGNPQFHQQMVYAVAMTTIRNFERALGRLALWSPRHVENDHGDWTPQYVRRLRIYPHALRQANAYYSPQKKALLFGYFPAAASDPAHQLPGGTVFTCLSHDVVVHETTHALLDGLHRRLLEPTNPDSLAFHEAFSDIVALFQHFSFPEVLRHQIAKTRGDLARQNMLGELAYEFGRATGVRGALRSAIGTVQDGRWKPHDPQPGEYKETIQPHTRGSHLVAAVFDAFLSIYKSRIADLLRIATGGTGQLPEGQLHPDLVNRLAEAAAKASQHVLNMCIRALDYCPPLDLTFGEYLRALITADYDLVRDDDRGYRIAMIEAFRRRGIYPEDIRTLSEDSLRWYAPTEDEQSQLGALLPGPGTFRKLMPKWDLTCDRREVFEEIVEFGQNLEALLRSRLSDPSAGEAFKILGLDGSLSQEELKVDSIRPARRIGPDGQSIVELVVEITQRLPGYWDARGAKNIYYSRAGTEGFEILRSYKRAKGTDADFWVRGGCTILIDPDSAGVRYAIVKNIRNTARFNRQVDYQNQAGGSLRTTYFGPIRRLEDSEAFAMLHRAQPEEASDD